MTRGNARELAVHLIYGREFTGEEPEEVVSVRLAKEYYEQLGQENEVYSDRPSRAQLRYIDSVVSGVANRQEELNDRIARFSIGWDVSRISRLTRAILQLAIFEILYVACDSILSSFFSLTSSYCVASNHCMVPFSLQEQTTVIQIWVFFTLFLENE